MEKASTRMDQLMVKSSNCCLMVVIAIELILLVLILKYFPS